MIRARTTSPRDLIIGVFLFLVAAVFAVAPLSVLFRSLGILLAAYGAFSAGGMPFAYAVALLAPPIGLVSGDSAWLVMLPLVLSSNLLAMLGLEYAWRYPALLISPALGLIPPLFVSQAAQLRLFSVELPWSPSAGAWLALHALVALAGVLVAIFVEWRRERHQGP